MRTTAPRHLSISLIASLLTLSLLTLSLLTLADSVYAQAPPLQGMRSLPDARRGFVTTLLVKKRNLDPVPPPPAGFELVRYHAPLGDFPAYVTTPPPGGGRHPAILWLAGGFSNSIGDTPWAPATPDNDQSARAFSRAGIITMYPSLRGGNGNPGYNECFYGEVDDVLAAGRYLASRPDVDPAHVYLGGHSTGATLALLAAESTSGFRAVFAFGAMPTVTSYAAENLPFSPEHREEVYVRSPALYQGSIETPTFLFEGAEAPGNVSALRRMCLMCTNPKLHFYEVPGLNHFSELAFVTPVVAAQIVRDLGAVPQFSFLNSTPKIVPVAR